MKLAYGKLVFEAGDALHVEDAVGKLTLTAERGHDCARCCFRAICDTQNPCNVMARFCMETHFVEEK